MKAIRTELICPHCGEIVIIYRRANKIKSVGHIKDMYCPYCKKDRKFIEIVDREKYYYKLLYRDKLSDIEQIIFDFLDKRKEKCKVYER